MNDAPRYQTFRDYVRVVRERRVLVVLITVAFTAAAVGWSVRQDPVYEAESSLEFKDENVDISILGSRTVTGGRTPEQRAAIEAQTIGRRELAEDAAKALKRRDVSADDVQRAVTARPEARTNLVVVSARWGEARTAAAIADAVARAARDDARDDARARLSEAADAQRRVLRELTRGRNRRNPTADVTRVLTEQEIGKLEQAARFVDPVEITREAAVPGAPVAPKPVRNGVLGLLLGLTVALVAAFTRDSLDRRFKTAREITEQLHLPLLGYVREGVLGRSLTGAGSSKPFEAPDLEGFRILRTNIEFLDVDTPPRTILVTSALPEEGKSTVSSALAAAYAAAGKRTLLVECDLRRATVAERLGLRAKPGLSDYLVGEASPPEVLQTVALPGGANGNGKAASGDVSTAPLVCLVAGSRTPQPAELLRSQRCKDFFAQVAAVYDAVVIDTSPLLSVVDALELIPLADAVVVCVRASQTTRDQARAARAAIEHLPPRPTGVVVTGIRDRDAADAYGYYSYGYVYGAERA